MQPVSVVRYSGLAPERQHLTDAGFDLRAVCEWVMIEPGQRALIDCGLVMQVPVGHVGLICPRSGLALRNGITVLNAPGIIDSGYRGQVGVILVNHGQEPYVVAEGDRVAQLVIVPLTPVVWEQGGHEELAVIDTRGAAGFGSTGVA